MKPKFDLVVRGGLVVDGTGTDPALADIGVTGGRIAEVGSIQGSGARDIDATGRLVTPGFVDVHTHYDGQVTWEDRLFASSAHGVTTAVMGNCGVGFAPCRPGDRDALIAMMEGVEDIPEAVMTEGLPWNWETFPDYLDAIERRFHDIDVAAQLPHSALRLYVMGERAVRREPANAQDAAQMEALAVEAMNAGALGFATSRLFSHRDRCGDPIPSLGAEATELSAIARGLKTANAGVIEAVVDFGARFEQEFDLLKMMARESGRPLTYSLAQLIDDPDHWREALSMTRRANDQGLKIRAQVIGRPTGLLLGHDLSFNPFSFYPSYEAIAHLSLGEKLKVLRRPEFRAQLLSEQPRDPGLPVLKYLTQFEWMFSLGDPPLYEPPIEANAVTVAARMGATPQDVVYDWMLERDGQAIVFLAVVNYAAGDLEAPLAMMRDPNTILGLGDGGAHYGVIMDSSYPTFMLTYWTRDRAGEKLSLPIVVKALSRDPAEAVGLGDRGVLAPGYKADINVIDYDRLQLRSPRVSRDLPGGGRRLFQAAEGFVATIVSGVTVNENGQPTGALPGRLVRGPQPSPLAPARAR